MADDAPERASRRRLPQAILVLLAAAGYAFYARFGGSIIVAAHASRLPPPLLLALALLGGVASFFTPCSIVLAPTFLTMAGSGVEGRRPPVARTLWLALGILVFYAAVGLLVGLVGTAIDGALAALIPVFGVVFLILGALVLTDRGRLAACLGRMNPVLLLEARSRTQPRGGLSLFSFGLAYGAAGHGCSLPIFLGIVLVPLAVGNILWAVLATLLYGGAIAASLVLVVALGRDLMPASGRLWGYRIQEAAGGLFLLTGAYLVLYFLRDVLGIL